MHGMRTIVIGDPGYLSVTWLCCANMAKQINILFRVETPGDSRNIVIYWSPDFPHGFYAAFAKLLWPLVYIVKCQKQTRFIQCSSADSLNPQT